MSIYNHILFAVDLINADDSLVVKKVREMQNATGAKLSIVHSIQFPTDYGAMYDVPNVATWEEGFEQSVKELFKKLATSLNVPEECRYIRNGIPRDQILELADEIGADLIIVGSHGRHGLGLLFLGSTANGVLHHAKCDVLAVRV